MTCNDSDSMLAVGTLCLFWISTDFTFVTLGNGDKNYLFCLSQGVIISCDLTPGTMPDELQISTEFQNTLTRELFKCTMR